MVAGVHGTAGASARTPAVKGKGQCDYKSWSQSSVPKVEKKSFDLISKIFEHSLINWIIQTLYRD